MIKKKSAELREVDRKPCTIPNLLASRPGKSTRDDAKLRQPMHNFRSRSCNPTVLRYLKPAVATRLGKGSTLQRYYFLASILFGQM